MAKRVAEIDRHHPQCVLARGGHYQVLEGEGNFDRYVLVRFGSVEEAITYYNSKEYQDAAAIGRAASEHCALGSGLID